MKKSIVTFLGGLSVLSLFLIATPAYANHSWGNYHWARTTSSFTLSLGDNVTSLWDARLGAASADWSQSAVLDTVVVPGQAKGNCQPTKGRVEVCNKAYGNNGWLGIASIWANGNHITQGTVKLNDTYFNSAKYNTLAWRQLVACQEIGHTFGLNHQDENFSNANLGTCMDYTNDPDGALYNQLSNTKPNQHDYDQLVTIYTHLDSLTTLAASAFGSAASAAAKDIDTGNPAEWGRVVRESSDGHGSLFERDLGHGDKLFTFVTWAN